MSDNRRIDPNDLIDRERIRGAKRVIAEGTDAAAVTAEQIRQVASDAELFIRTHNLHRKDVARAVGYSATVITQVIGGKYPGNSAQVAIDLESWLVEEEQRRSRPQTTQFTWTNVAMQIKAVANYCLDCRKVGMVYGPDTSGVGKTTAMRAILQELGPRRCSLATVDKVDASPNGLLRKLCKAIGEPDSGTNKQRFDRLVENLSGRSHLLLIDQIHNLRWSKNDKPFYYLTDLWDATQTAQLWCGTADLVAYLERQQSRSADESLSQVCRRIFPRVDLMESMRNSADGGGEPLVSIQQVREMFARNKLRLTDAAARFLCQLCNEPDGGSVGLAVQIVEYSTVMGSARGLGMIDVPQLRDALRCGLSPCRSELLLRRMETDPVQHRPARAG